MVFNVFDEEEKEKEPQSLKESWNHQNQLHQEKWRSDIVNEVTNMTKRDVWDEKK